MGPYLLRRLLLAVPTLVGVSLVAFVLVALSPGDPALAVLGERATHEEYVKERARQGLDDPLPVRYVRWAGHIVRGDLGTSSRSRRQVSEELRERWPATAELTLAALLLATTLGIAAGVVAAARRGSVFDHVAMTSALAGVSLPVFWLGLMLLIVATRLWPSWPTQYRLPSSAAELVPVTGLLLVDTLLRGRPDLWLLAARHLMLPALALGTIPMAIISRMTRSSVLETLSQDYVRTARAKGLSPRDVYLRHALRAALIPIVTVIGLEFGYLLGGAIITEQVFGWPGIGNWILQGVEHRDRDVIQAGVLVIACGFVVINLAVDMLYAVVDPRIRHA